ncbi:helix-turn-helix domain-containing protein, partial [Kitasatospora nipponensis]|uniref:helix-turn-helix domain-containing protein n=1 Tax=Kitasatospora nipponensis TaxID=258049 RepID=UPI003CD0A40A
MNCTSSRTTMSWNLNFRRRNRVMVTVPGASPAERLRTLREMLGPTQGEMATMAGLSPAWISSVETQAREATEDGLRAIASGTGTPMSFFSAAPSTVPLDS